MRTRNRKKLTGELLRKSLVMKRRYRIWDTVIPQLFASIAPTGIISLNVQWSRQRPKSLGKFPGVTLETAREQAHDILSDASKHGTPAVAKSFTLGDTNVRL